jgi:hypothetical protein
VKVMNVLDVSQTSSNTLEQLSNADIGFLEGIPGGMFDWGQWETYFARFEKLSSSENGNTTFPAQRAATTAAAP